MADVVRVSSLAELQRAVANAELPVAIAGGRHAMGGQQFCSGDVLLDTSSLARVLEFDRDSATSAAGARPPLRG